MTMIVSYLFCVVVVVGGLGRLGRGEWWLRNPDEMKGSMCCLVSDALRSFALFFPQLRSSLPSISRKKNKVKI